MTTYKFYKNMITVFSDDNNEVFLSDTQLKQIFSLLLSDFLAFARTLPIPSSKHYFNVYNMIEKLSFLRGTCTTLFLVEMLRNLLSIVGRYNYPKFRIIFVNEI